MKDERVAWFRHVRENVRVSMDVFVVGESPNLPESEWVPFIGPFIQQQQ